MIPRKLAAKLIFLSPRAYSFFKLPTFSHSFSSLDPYSNYVVINISLKNSFFLSETSTLSLFTLLWRIVQPILFSLCFSFLQKSFYSEGPLLLLPSLGIKRYFRPSWRKSVLLGHLLWPPSPQWSWHPYSSSSFFQQLLLCDISFAPYSFLFSCFWEVLQDLNSNLLAILLAVPLTPLCRLNECSPSLTFEKARWYDFALHIDLLYPSTEKYSFFSVSSAAALFASLALHVAKSFIIFDRVWRQPKVLWNLKVEGKGKTQGFCFRSQKWWRAPGLLFSLLVWLFHHRQSQS